MLLTYCWALNNVSATVCSRVPGTGSPGTRASDDDDDETGETTASDDGDDETFEATDEDDDEGSAPTMGNPLY